MAQVEASATADMFVTSIAKALGAPIRDVEREVVGIRGDQE
jgi:hypothetical protein